MTPFITAGAGFLGAVLWFDLMHDVQVRGRREPELTEAVLASIAGYYRRVTTEARPMNRLVALAMLTTVGTVAAQLASARPARWVGGLSMGLVLAPVLLAGVRTVPNAVRLGRRAIPWMFRASWPDPSGATMSSASPPSSPSWLSSWRSVVEDPGSRLRVVLPFLPEALGTLERPQGENMTDVEKPPMQDWATDFDHTPPDYAAQATEIWDDLRGRCPVAEPSLLPVAVEEFLRFYAPVTMARIVKEEVEVGGCTFKHGTGSCLPSRPPTGTRSPVITPTTSSSTASATATRPSDWGSTAAWARTWPGWR
ncbi:MAG TPA: hypothetical protein VNF50_12210 [Acidimicrobiales bacterium]|nr:hypothetical protein [Acidimicrobiales bacterium]